MGFHYSAIFVSLADLDGNTLKKFYQALLDQPPTVDIPEVYAEFQWPRMRLGLFTPKADHQEEFAYPSSGNMSLCIEVEHLETAIAHLTHLGCPPPGDIQQASHGREIYAYDPCGNRLILHESKRDVLG